MSWRCPQILRKSRASTPPRKRPDHASIRLPPDYLRNAFDALRCFMHRYHGTGQRHRPPAPLPVPRPQHPRSSVQILPTPPQEPVPPEAPPHRQARRNGFLPFSMHSANASARIYFVNHSAKANRLETSPHYPLALTELPRVGRLAEVQPLLATPFHMVRLTGVLNTGHSR